MPDFWTLAPQIVVALVIVFAVAWFRRQDRDAARLVLQGNGERPRGRSRSDPPSEAEIRSPITAVVARLDVLEGDVARVEGKVDQLDASVRALSSDHANLGKHVQQIQVDGARTSEAISWVRAYLTGRGSGEGER